MRKQGMPNVSRTELDLAVQNIDDAKTINTVLIWRDFDYSKNNCLNYDKSLLGSTAC